MNTIEDFKNAPTGATASHKTMGIRVMKVNDGHQCWITPGGGYLSDEEVALRDFALVPPAPTTVREAFNRWLEQVKAEAWEEGHSSSDTSWDHIYSGHSVPEGELCPECFTGNPYRKERTHE